MDKKEQKWIRAILRHSSQDAADKLVRAYYDEIYVYVYRQVGNKEDAMDITQESFIAALQSLPNYKPERAGFRTWLYRITSYKVIDARRRMHPDIVPLEEAEIADIEDFAKRINDRELLDRINDYVDKMKPEVQKIFRLHLYEELSFPEIAKQTGQPESKIKAQYYRLLQKIRKEFQQHG